MEGTFTYSNVPVRWTLCEDGESGDAGNDWMLQIRNVDFSVSRRYPETISHIDAEREARTIAPMLLQIAEAWLK